MSRALEYELRGRTRRVGVGQAVVPDILRDLPADAIAGTEPAPVAPAAEGFLGLPVLAWVALGAGFLFLSGRR